ncbi:hypothetical protein L7F22_035136 [Adiantum nelumboides]|nr:hypothetical protein [Adiantum nelumboides]
MFIGTNGATYLDTAALLTCLPKFSSNRGTVVGLLKGFKGLCGAIFNQIYASFLAPDQTSFILFIALVPTVLMVPLILIMGPSSSAMETTVMNDNKELNFQLLCGASMLLAAYLLNVTLVQDLRSVSDITNVAFTVVLFVILLLPLFTPKIADFSSKRHIKATTQLKNPLLGETHRTVTENGLTTQASNVQTEVFFSMGSGTTAFNNLRQIAEAQGYENAEVLVSMCNIWNFVGHLVGGYLSEVSTSNCGHPRTLLLAVAQHCYGVEWAVFPAAVSELFGLQNFGVLYNVVTIANPAGSPIYSTFIAGPVYDRQAREQGSSTCEGTICFETTFFVMAAVCVIGASLSIALAIRTRSFYRRCQPS